MPWWVPYDDAACDWGIPPWAILERQQTHGDGIEWVRRHRTLTNARRDAG